MYGGRVFITRPTAGAGSGSAAGKPAAADDVAAIVPDEFARGEHVRPVRAPGSDEGRDDVDRLRGDVREALDGSERGREGGDSSHVWTSDAGGGDARDRAALWDNVDTAIGEDDVQGVGGEVDDVGHRKLLAEG